MRRMDAAEIHCCHDVDAGDGLCRRLCKPHRWQV
eukprot:SAG22_NODE_19373_length_275_cov_1.164773_2_plen_33_part_01